MICGQTESDCPNSYQSYVAQDKGSIDARIWAFRFDCRVFHQRFLTLCFATTTGLMCSKFDSIEQAGIVVTQGEI
jgi:hypothetical protein